MTDHCSLIVKDKNGKEFTLFLIPKSIKGKALRTDSHLPKIVELGTKYRRPMAPQYMQELVSCFNSRPEGVRRLQTSDEGTYSDEPGRNESYKRGRSMAQPTQNRTQNRHATPAGVPYGRTGYTISCFHAQRVVKREH